jgi:hypothetical protein
MTGPIDMRGWFFFNRDDDRGCAYDGEGRRIYKIGGDYWRSH